MPLVALFPRPWSVVTMCAAAAAARYAAWRVQLPDVRWARGLCVGCGYDLTGNVSGVCPECG